MTSHGWQQCPPTCGHGSCVKLVGDTQNQYFCMCEEGWAVQRGFYLDATSPSICNTHIPTYLGLAWFGVALCVLDLPVSLYLLFESSGIKRHAHKPLYRRMHARRLPILLANVVGLVLCVSIIFDLKYRPVPELQTWVGPQHNLGWAAFDLCFVLTLWSVWAKHLASARVMAKLTNNERKINGLERVSIFLRVLFGLKICTLFVILFLHSISAEIRPTVVRWSYWLFFSLFFVMQAAGSHFLCSATLKDIHNLLAVETEIKRATSSPSQGPGATEAKRLKKIKHAARRLKVLRGVLVKTGLAGALLCFLCATQDFIFQQSLIIMWALGLFLVVANVISQVLHFMKKGLNGKVSPAATSSFQSSAHPFQSSAHPSSLPSL